MALTLKQKQLLGLYIDDNHCDSDRRAEIGASDELAISLVEDWKADAIVRRQFARTSLAAELTGLQARTAKNEAELTLLNGE